MSCSPGCLVVSAIRDTTIKFWEVSTGYCLRTFTGHTDWVRCLAVSADGALLASGGNDQSIIIWAVSSGAQVSILREHSHVIEALVFPPPGVELKLDGANYKVRRLDNGWQGTVTLFKGGSYPQALCVCSIPCGCRAYQKVALLSALIGWCLARGTRR